jgi:membrane associated rhomboid family serine protease
MLDIIFGIALWVVVIIGIFFILIPIGNENSTVRRPPLVTFSIIGTNVVIFFATLPAATQQARDIGRTEKALHGFLLDNDGIEKDPRIRSELREAGVISKREADEIETQLAADDQYRHDWELWLKGSEAATLRTQCETLLADYRTATDASIWYRYGLAPNGNWHFHQLITAAFLHGGISHLLFNMIFLFAVAFSLEDLWGRGMFLLFYFLAAAAACLPEVLNPGTLPSIGASGAISATMGAFLVRLYNSKIKIFWISAPLLPFWAIMKLALGKRPWGVVNIRAYIYLPYYFVAQVLYWWWSHKVDTTPTVGYSAHIAGFIVGAAFAGMISLTRIEERHIHPKIEAKVSFHASPEVIEGLGLLDRGEVHLAEKKLKTRLARYPDDVSAIMALIQVYQRTLNYAQLNLMYGRLIRHHLANNDKEAALYAYDGLLSSFPDEAVAVTIPIRDWLTLCEYLAEAEMNREAAVEYERLIEAYPEDPFTVRACVQGAEAALLAHDNARALRLFELAETLNPKSPMQGRVELGLEKCRLRIETRPNWVKENPKTQELQRDTGERNAHW